MSSQSLFALPSIRCPVPCILVAAAVASPALVPAAAFAQSSPIEVLGGGTATIPGNYASGTYSTLTVSGTGPGGTRSTLAIDEALTLDGDYQVLSVIEGGLVNLNADVTSVTGAYSWGRVADGGTLNLVSGTLTIGELLLSGTGAVQRSGGAFATDYLTVGNGAVARFTANDVIGRGGMPGSVSIDTGATLELGASLSAGYLTISGSGSTLARVTGSETLDMRYEVLVTGGANLQLVAGDAIRMLGVGWGESTVTPAPGTSVFTTEGLYLGPGGTIAGLDAIPYAVQSLFVAGQRMVYRSGVVTDSISNSVVLDSGTLTLQQDLTLSGSYSYLYISGTASALERNGNAVSTSSLTLDAAVGLTVGDGISVGRSITLRSYADGAPMDLTLANDLVLTASDGELPQISLSGSNSRLVRSSPGLTITATGATIQVSEGATLAMQAGDTFTNSYMSADSGAMVSSAGPLTLASVRVSGTDYLTGAPATFTAHGPLVVNGSTTSLQVDFGGRFVADANVTVDTADVQTDGGLEILSGTFTAALLAVSGTVGGFSVDRSGGAAYAIGSLRLYWGATTDFEAATDTLDALEISGGAVFSTGTGGGALALDSLLIQQSIGAPQAQVRLGSLGGTGGPGAWGLRTPDSQFDDLVAWVADGSILALSGTPLTVTRQDGFAYVMTVPEPAALALLAGGIATVCVVCPLSRRRKSHRG